MTAEATAALHPAEQYMDDVLKGRIVVNKWVMLAMKRQARDLKTAAARNIYFDRAAAERAIRFFTFLRHSKGKWAGHPFHLSPWEQFIIWCIFGWKISAGEKAGCRRFRTTYIKVARKNGKSTFAAGVGLFLFVADGEAGAEVYTAATKREQARIVHGEAVAMVRSSPDLKRRIQIYKDNLNIPNTRSKFVPLGADENTDDGLNVSGAIVDELHAHKTRNCLDVLDSATGSRKQPLIFIITTAGKGRLGVDQETQLYAEKVLDGRWEDDSFFAIIYAVDEKDNWEDESCWIKANPNLGISVSLEDMRALARKAKITPSARNEFLQKRLNRQTEAAVVWISKEKWDACAEPMTDEELKGRTCFYGWDLSSKLDVAGYAILFPPEEREGGDEKWRVKVRLFVPEETAQEREESAKASGALYATWGEEGHLILTPGNVIDYEFIKAAMLEDAKQFALVESGFDPWNANQLALQMMDHGMVAVEVAQNFRSLSDPSKELEKLVISRSIGHDGNPVLNWMASNVAIQIDPAGNIKPSKKHSAEKIDGIVMIVTAMARALMSGGEAYGEGHDLLVLK